MNIFIEFQNRIKTLLQAMQAEGRLPGDLDLNHFTVEPPRDASHGDLSCNAAMVYARESKPAFNHPRQLASELAFSLAEMPDVDQAEVAGPGFLNIKLKKTAFVELLRQALLQGDHYGALPATGRKINIEYVSANPTGPMHVGHARGAVFGDALANLLTFAGEEVVREYYINDAGAQIEVLANSAFLRYREALGETIEIPEGLYPGDYLKPLGQALARQYKDALLAMPAEQWLPVVREAAISSMMEMIRADLKALNITHDVFFSESELIQKTDADNGEEVIETIDWLRDHGLVYVGRLPPPKGAPSPDWEDRDQTLFRSTEFGDDVDRPLLKSDGSYTYFANDIAYHKTKIDRGFTGLIDVLGADHGGYVKRMQGAVKALSEGRVHLDVKLCQLVKLMRDGEPIKMSKRGGEFVTLRDVVDEVGVDATRFMMIFRKNDAALDFDLAKVLEQSKENPVFYVQYAHARGKSVVRQALSAFSGLNLSTAALAAADLGRLTDAGEEELIRTIALFPRIIEQAALAHEPHRIAFYLHELAQRFHSHWNCGKESPHLRFINEKEQELSYARLALVICLTNVLASGLSILGVSAPEEMR